MLRAQPLIDFEFCRSEVFPAGMNVVQAEAVVSVGKVRVQFQGTRIFGNDRGVAGLVGLEFAKLLLASGNLGLGRKDFCSRGRKGTRLDFSYLPNLVGGFCL